MSTPPQQRLPSLDGWRAVAILIVLTSHCPYSHGWPNSWTSVARWLPDGGFGVDIFFVISGFLITFLLLKERERTACIDLKGFYLRRTLRIVPAYVVFLLAIAVLDCSTGLQVGPAAWLALCTYTVNYASWTPWTVGHVWSLSVEEQFYLLWPVVFILATASQASARSLLIALSIPLVLCPISRVVGYISHSRAFTACSFLSRADSLAVGCLTAVVLSNWRQPVTDLLSRHFSRVILLAMACISIPHVLMKLFLLGPLTVPLGPTLSAIGIALIVLASVLFPTIRLFAWLQWGPLTHIGVLSYSIYLWQQLFSTKPEVFGLSGSPWFLTFPYWLVPAFAAAIASYCLIERPFLSLKSRVGRAHRRPAG